MEGVGYKYADLGEMSKVYDINTLKDGWNTVNGEKIFYISNPAVGLWAYRKRFEEAGSQGGGAAAASSASASAAQAEDAPPTLKKARREVTEVPVKQVARVVRLKIAGEASVRALAQNRQDDCTGALHVVIVAVFSKRIGGSVLGRH